MTESDLARAERWSQDLLESAPDAMVIVNRDGEILLANRQAEVVFGYAREELLGKPIELLIPERYRSAHGSYRRQFLAQPRLRPMHARGELYGLRKDGTEMPVEISLSPIEGPRELVVVCAVRDITERKQAEALLKQRQDELAHVTRVSMAGEMAAGLAHELNQPLYSIANYARGCIHRLESNSIDLAEVGVVAREIAKEAERAAEIIRRLRRMVQKRESARSVVRVSEVVREAWAMCQVELKYHRICIDMNLASSLPAVCADEIQLQQVLSNLIRNATEAMKDVPADQRYLRLVARQDDSGPIHVMVTDTGRGIPSGDLDRVFDAFYTTSASGMGMGLAISRSIIESHGGRIWAVNNPTQGVTFHFTLPVYDAANHEKRTHGIPGR